MATPADQRLLELLDKWRRSLELHAEYSTLDDDRYWKVQPWVEHQRPAGWIIDLARQKTEALRLEVEERIEAGDKTFSDALELMIFLANLVGSQHIERFIPVAEAGQDRPPDPAPPEEDASSEAEAVSGTREMPKALRRPADPNAGTGTREMPRLTQSKRASPPAGTAEVARAERKSAEDRPQSKAPRQAGKASAKPDKAAREQVIADAVRLAQWGRKWFEMPELIARMAGRPSLAEVRRILKESKTVIDSQSGERTG